MKSEGDAGEGDRADALLGERRINSEEILKGLFSHALSDTVKLPNSSCAMRWLQNVLPDRWILKWQSKAIIAE